MSSPSLNLNFVMPALAVGGRFELEACEHLVQSLGIRRVVDVRLEACDDEAVLRQHGIELLHLPTADHHAVDLQKLAAQQDAFGQQYLKNVR